MGFCGALSHTGSGHGRVLLSCFMCGKCSKPLKRSPQKRCPTVTCNVTAVTRATLTPSIFFTFAFIGINLKILVAPKSYTLYILRIVIF